jgi:hypothetical protein
MKELKKLTIYAQLFKSWGRRWFCLTKKE